jgi:hypothetical protein
MNKRNYPQIVRSFLDLMCKRSGLDLVHLLKETLTRSQVTCSQFSSHKSRTSRRRGGLGHFFQPTLVGNLYLKYGGS